MTFKKFLIILLIMGAVITLIYFHKKGILEWQTLSIIGAAFIAPFRSLIKFLQGDKELEQIDTEHDRERAEHDAYRQKLDLELAQIEERISKIQKNIDGIDQSLLQLESKKAQIQKRIESMTVEEKQKALQEAFG